MSDSFFKAIADGNRRKILDLLRKRGPLNAGELHSHFQISPPALSEHLKVLREAGLIAARKDRQFIYYSLNTTVLEDLISWLKGHLDKNEVKSDETE